MIDDLSDWLRRLKDSGKCVLVEGKKDKRALEAFGIANIQVVAGKPLYHVVESVNGNDVVILTDLDPEGRKLYGKLKNALQKRKVRVDSTFREFLFKGTHLTHIEGLVTYARSTS